MGNTESSSGLPQRVNDGTQRPNRGPGKKPNDEGEEAQSSTMGSALKVGAAVAGGALLALGAWSLASSSGSADSERRKVTMEQYEPNGMSGSRHRGSDGYRLEGSSPRSYSDRLGYESGMITIMTYNVSCKDVKLDERMGAIGRLIEKHSPDLIFFQEVTMKILGIFQRSVWWEEYKCSELPEKTKPQFCMLLSKSPETEFNTRVLGDSGIKRKLPMARIKVGWGKELVVATSHFKRPESSEMYSQARQNQAKEALKHLESFPNVVFGGDTNWSEYSDGPFPLSDGWIDAWQQLMPGESGWTYDTKSNPMLLGNELVQERLDRFICKLKDFKARSVEIIGRDAIPGVFYDKDGKELPVLPSDHYGLLLTIESL